MKKCTKCKREQPVTEFKADSRMTLGLSSWCKSCGREAARARYAADPEKARARVKASRNRSPEYNRQRHLRHLYGMTVAEHAALLVAQGAACAICGIDQPGGKTQAWHTDHDHETKKVRGILCHSCNIGLGHFGDSIERLTAAIDYLKRNA